MIKPPGIEPPKMEIEALDQQDRTTEHQQKYGDRTKEDAFLFPVAKEMVLDGLLAEYGVSKNIWGCLNQAGDIS